MPAARPCRSSRSSRRSSSRSWRSASMPPRRSSSAATRRAQLDLAALAGARLLHDDATRPSGGRRGEGDRGRSCQRLRHQPSDDDDALWRRRRDQVPSRGSTRTSTRSSCPSSTSSSAATTRPWTSMRARCLRRLRGDRRRRFAILALEGCPSPEKSIDFSGSNVDVIGRVHSNSDLYISGSNNDFERRRRPYTCGVGETSTPSITAVAATRSTRHPAHGDSTEPDPVDLRLGAISCPARVTQHPAQGMWDLAERRPVVGRRQQGLEDTDCAGTYCSGTGSSDGIKLSDSNIVIEDIVSGPGGSHVRRPGLHRDLRLRTSSSDRTSTTCSFVSVRHVGRRA